MAEFCGIIRPNNASPAVWSIQTDADHANTGILSLTQNTNDLILNLTPALYGRVGACIIQSDDGFTQDRIIGVPGGMGSTSVRITLWRDTLIYSGGGWVIQRVQLQPGQINSYRSDLTNGNFFIVGRMY